ncbi:MAG: hypothetical protein LBK60_00865 [Verrucomicrobiales bacterium]|jgi:alpha-mannosidase|nr:hypothetical protein [Verrucomicrobiales bacterium]
MTLPTLSLAALEQSRKIARWHDDAAWLRAREQLRFAAWLARQPEADAAWPALVARAGEADWADGCRVAAEVEEGLRPLAAAAKKFTVRCVGHAHVDMNWLWGWPETVNVVLDSFRTVLALLEEFPEFCFSQSQASIYQIVQDYDPALLPRIAAFVRAGRWEVTASHWVENEANLAGAEALAQHLLQTRAYMRELFGLAPEEVAIDWAPDTFGFAATTPSYLAQGGVRYVFLHRPGDLRQPVPEAFWWQGPDGARVLAHNAQYAGYNGIIDPEQVLAAVWRARRQGRDGALLVYGVGDHGGGPTRRDLLFAREMARWPVFPTLALGPARGYFEWLEQHGAGLPVIADELNVEFGGCYTTQTLVKRANRIGEARMQEVETAAALARGLALPVTVPAHELAASWRRVLFMHFHDILPGSCVRDARLYAHGQFQETMAFTSTTTARLLRELAARVDTAGGPGGADDDAAGGAARVTAPVTHLLDGRGAGAGIGAAEGSYGQAHGHEGSPARPFVIVNLTGAARAETVSFTLWDREFAETAGEFQRMEFAACTAAGAPLPVQRLTLVAGHTCAPADWGHAKQIYAAAVTVPAFGYTTVVFRERLADIAPEPPPQRVWLAEAAHHCPYARKERPAVGMENERLRVAFDPADGRVTSLFDKETGAELLDPAGLRLEYAVERSGPMNAWVINSAGPEVVPALVSLRPVATGPLHLTIEAVYRVARSTVTLLWRLDAGSRQLRLTFNADWLEAGTAATGVPNLRLAAGTALRDAVATYEVPFGAITRQVRADKEVPAQRWALVESPTAPAALLVLNDCKYGHALAGGTLRVNLIRSAYDPDPFPELGQHQAAFAFEPVPRATDRASLTAKAQAFNHPLLLMGTSAHGGDLPAEAALVTVSGAGVSVSALKRPAEGEGLLLRLCNTLDTPAPATVDLHPLLGTPARAHPVDLLERPTAPPQPLPTGVLTVTLPPRGIVSYIMHF